MPRVNRDLQRRMAARRERERRRPAAERRYSFAAPEPAIEPADDLVETSNGEALTQPPPARSRAGRDATVATQAPQTSVRGGARPGPRPFSEYRADYAYVLSDLKRIGLVVGGLLLVLILLYFVLPH
jgi:hypothetical protein